MDRRPEAAPEPQETIDVVPTFFRLGPVNNSRVKDVLHHIQRFGMEDPQSTHQLLSLFQPEEFTDDPFHVLSANSKPYTLWDQVAETATNEKNLTGDQKGAIMSIKYFALQSLAETPGLPESVRDAAKTELREYDAYLAKIFDPEDPASARFLDRAKVVGKIAGKAAKAGGTAYLMLNLMGCYGEGITPTPVELPTITTNPAITETVPAIETPSPTEFQPDLTPSGTETFTETPLPVLSEHPTSEELFAAKQGELPNIFTFGGHKWTAETNDTGEKVWMREDGKVDFEWASLYGGGVYNAYMFVTRSTPAEGKRTLEIYADPRIPYFFLITGSPDEVDTFVGTTVADYLQGAAAKAALKQPGSTLRIISGGIEYWPIGGSNAWRPQDISYYGPNGEILWQKIWGVKFSGSGETGPFVEPSGVAVQCGKFRGPESFFTFIPQYIQDNPIYGDVMAEQDVATAIRYCSYYDPDKTKLTPSGFTPESVPVVKTELIDVK